MDPNGFSRDQSLMGRSIDRGWGTGRGESSDRGGFRGRGTPMGRRSSLQLPGEQIREQVNPTQHGQFNTASIGQARGNVAQQQNGQRNNHSSSASSAGHNNTSQHSFGQEMGGRSHGRGRGRGRDNIATQQGRRGMGDNLISMPQHGHQQYPLSPSSDPWSLQSSMAHLSIHSQSLQQSHPGYLGPISPVNNRPIMDLNLQSGWPTAPSTHAAAIDPYNHGQPTPSRGLFSQPSSNQITGHERTALTTGVHVPIRYDPSEGPSASVQLIQSLEAGEVFQSLPLSYILANSPHAAGSDFMTTANALDTFTGRLYASILERLSIPPYHLEEFGYRTKDLTDQELLDKRRCEKCNKSWHKVRKAQEHEMNLQASASTQHAVTAPKEQSKETGLICRFHPGRVIGYKQSPAQSSKRQLQQDLGPTTADTEPTATSGSSMNKGPARIWSCCKKPLGSEPCSGNKLHSFNTTVTQYLPTPAERPLFGHSYRHAVALDCEMGLSRAGESELIRVTLIDYFTTEILVDKLVFPSVPMRHLNTKYSGVTWDMLNSAAARGECIRGRVAARDEVWKFVGPRTIVVAHSGHNDLNSLHWRHNHIVDTYLLEWWPDHERQKELQAKAKREREALEKESRYAGLPIPGQLNESDPVPASKQDHKQDAGKQDDKQDDKRGPDAKTKGGVFSLKALTKKCLNRDIQTGLKGHNSLEDAIASRDLAHWRIWRILEGRDEVALAQPTFVW